MMLFELYNKQAALIADCQTLNHNFFAGEILSVIWVDNNITQLISDRGFVIVLCSNLVEFL